MPKIDEIVGQEKTKTTIRILLEAAQKDNRPLPHCMFMGPSGFGKTSLAKAIASDSGRAFYEYNAASIKDSINMTFTMHNISKNSIVFIDEIHRMNMKAQEAFYTIMEGSYFNMVVGNEQIDKIEVPPFSLFGATTSTVGAPMLGRFRHVFHFEPYTDNEIAKIVFNLDKSMPGELVASYCRGVPRNAVNFVGWLQDYFKVGNEPINKSSIEDAMFQIGIYDDGLTVEDLCYLDYLNKQGKLVGIRTIAHALNMDEKRIREDIEPFLLKKGYIYRLPRGRMINKKKTKCLLP